MFIFTARIKQRQLTATEQNLSQRMIMKRTHHSTVAKLLGLLCTTPSLSGIVVATVADADSSNPITSPQQPAKQIHTLMCETESCTNADASTPGCRQYATPLETCYNAKALFPGDDSWSEFDIYDEMIMRNLKRTFYQSVDGSCAGRDGESDNSVPQPVDGEDSFILPLGDCVGPFGPPRPWGKFSLVGDDADDHEEQGESLASS